MQPIRLLLLAGLAVLGLISSAAAQQPGPRQEIIVSAEPCLQKKCLRTAETKKVTKTVYSSKQQEYCLPRRPVGGFLGGLFRKKECCSSCDGGECGKVRCKNVLVKKFTSEEKCVQPCKVQHVAAPCVAAPCAAAGVMIFEPMPK